jgi:hypothetical protein
VLEKTNDKLKHTDNVRNMLRTCLRSSNVSRHDAMQLSKGGGGEYIVSRLLAWSECKATTETNVYQQNFSHFFQDVK